MGARLCGTEPTSEMAWFRAAGGAQFSETLGSVSILAWYLLLGWGVWIEVQEFGGPCTWTRRREGAWDDMRGATARLKDAEPWLDSAYYLLSQGLCLYAGKFLGGEVKPRS